jgi:DNA-binding transcriptional ArsR family regulator
MPRANSSNAADDAVVRELGNIKKLLILQLMVSGVEAQHIARALGIAKSTLSGLVPARAVQKSKG